MPTAASYSPPEVADSDDDQAEDGEDDVVISYGLASVVSPRQRVVAKYRCSMTGSTWSGRGLKPAWLRVALDSGKQLSDFEIAAQPA